MDMLRAAGRVRSARCFCAGNPPFENSTPGYLYLPTMASRWNYLRDDCVNFLNGANFGKTTIVHLSTSGSFGHGTTRRLIRARQSRPQSHFDYGTFSRRGGGTLRSSIGWPRSAACRSMVRRAWTISLRLVRRGGLRRSAVYARHRSNRCARSYFVIHGQGFGCFTFEDIIRSNAHTLSIWRILPFPMESSRRYCGSTKQITTSSTAFGRRNGTGVAMPRGSQELLAKVHLGALAQAVLLDRAEYSTF